MGEKYRLEESTDRRSLIHINDCFCVSFLAFSAYFDQEIGNITSIFFF